MLEFVTESMCDSRNRQAAVRESEKERARDRQPAAREIKREREKQREKERDRKREKERERVTNWHIPEAESSGRKSQGNTLS